MEASRLLRLAFFLGLCASGCRDREPVAVYFLAGERLHVVERSIDPEEAPETLFESLLAGPTEEERARGLTTEIPRETELLGVTLAGDTAFVNVSSPLHQGGGSLSMRARLAQLVYTATALPGIERMQLLIEGETAEALGGEGVLVETPMDRERFADLAPVEQ